VKQRHPDVPLYAFGFRQEKTFQKHRPDHVKRSKEAQMVGEHHVVSFEWPRNLTPRTAKGTKITFAHNFMCITCGKMGGCKRAIETTKCRPNYGKSQSVIDNMTKLKDQAGEAYKERIQKAIDTWEKVRRKTASTHPAIKVKRILPAYWPEGKIMAHFICQDCGRHAHSAAHMKRHDRSTCAKNWSQNTVWLAKQRIIAQKLDDHDTPKQQLDLLCNIFGLDSAEINAEVCHEVRRLEARQNSGETKTKTPKQRERKWITKLKGTLHNSTKKRCNRKTRV